MDIATLNTVNMLLLLMYAAIVMVLVPLSAYLGAARWFALACFLRGFALIWIGPYSSERMPVTVMLHLCVIAGFVATYRAYSLVLDADRRGWIATLWVGAASAVVLIAAAFFGIDVFSIVVAAEILVLLSLSGWLVFRCRLPRLRSSASMVGTMLFAYAILQALRLAALCFGSPELKAASLEGWLLGAVLANSGMVFGFLMLVKARLRMQIETMAHRDPLTGALNRLGLGQVVRPRIERLQKAGHTTAFLTMDLDGMKRANDDHGHDCGDAVLVAVCDTLRASLPVRAQCARMGGDEFLIVIPDVSRSQVLDIAENLRAAIHATQLETWPTVRVSASFGVAMGDGERWSFEDLIRSSDQALLDAKSSGRNCVVCAPDEGNDALVA